MRKTMQKFISLLLCLCMLCSLCIQVFAVSESNSKNVVFSLSLDRNILRQSSDPQTVTMTIQMSEAADVVDMEYDIVCDSSFTIAEPSVPGGISAWNPDTRHMSWMNSVDVTTDTLGSAVITIPGDMAPGTYTISVQRITLSDNDSPDYWEDSASASATLTITADPAEGHGKLVNGICSECGETVYAVVQKGRNLSYEDMIYVIDIFDLQGFDLANVDLTTDAGLLFWSAEEYEALNGNIAYDEAHANPGLAPYLNTTFYYGTSTGIYTRYLHQESYYVGYVKLADGSYVYSEARLYSPATYAYNMINKEETKAETKELCYALLNYISAAQMYFYPETVDADLVNAELTDDQKALVWENPAMNLAGTVPADKDVTRDSSVFTGRGKNLLFEEQISLVAVFKIDTAKVTSARECGTIFWTAEQFAALNGAPSIDNYGEGTISAMDVYMGVDGQWCSESPKVAPKDMADTEFYFLAYVIDAEGNVSYSGVQCYTFEQYINNTVASSKSSDAMVAFAQRLYYYERAAQAALK